MSQTEAATTGGPRKREAAVPAAAAVPQPVRWVVLFTGTKATEDYQPFASASESDALVQEVTKMGVAFHPHSEIRLFPTKDDVLLFWQAKATGDWIVTRVALAPNPQGVRTSLEYVSLIFSAADLARLGHDPFRALALGLHDKVREQFLAKNFTPVVASLSPGGLTAGGGEVPGAVSADRFSTAENIAALRALSGGRGEGSPPPPTFATWWANSGAVPADYFAIVLKAAPVQVLTLRDAGEAASALAAEVKAVLPNSPAGDAVAAEMARGLLRNADAVSTEVAGAGSHLNDESADQFRGRLMEAARLASQVATDLTAYGRRLGDGKETPLGGWVPRYEALAADLPKVRHPNPFAAARNTNGAASGTAAVSGGGGTARTPAGSGSAGGGAKYGIIAAAVAVVGLGVFALSQMNKGGGSKGNEGATTVSATHAGKTAPVTSPVAATTAATVDAGIAVLKSNGDRILADAKTRARGDAKTAATGAGSAGLSENAVEKITFNAVKMSYKESLTPDDFKKAFTRPAPWTYATLQQTLPTLVSAVHEAAVVSATEAKAASVAAQATAQATAQAKVKLAAAEAAAAAKTSRDSSGSSESGKPRHRDNGGDSGESSKPTRTAATTKHDSSGGGDSEKPKPKPPKPTVSAPKAGSAADTGL